MISILLKKQKSHINIIKSYKSHTRLYITVQMLGGCVQLFKHCSVYDDRHSVWICVEITVLTTFRL
jgi:hypothetical protein